MAKSKYRIDGISYPDGSQVCVVVGPGGLHVFRSKDYREEDEDGTPPAMLALREAQGWIKAQGTCE